MSTDVTLPTEISVSPATQINVSANTPVTAGANLDLSVRSKKKEYSIVGDGLYAKVSGDTTPEWLLSTIDLAISLRLDDALFNLDNVVVDLTTAINEIELARNSYEELINIEATINQVIATRVAQLDARIDNASSKITTIEQAYVDETTATALAAQQISASLNAPGGELYGAVSSINMVITSIEDTVQNNYDFLQQLNEDSMFTLATQINVLEAKVDGATATVSQEMVAFATDAGTAGARYKLNLKTTGVVGPGGVPATLIGGMVLETNGLTMKSGFDVDEFWIGRVGADGAYPFHIVNGVVSIKEAAIQTLRANKIKSISGNDDIFYEKPVNGVPKTFLKSDVLETNEIVSKNFNPADKTGLQINLETGEFTIYGATSGGTSGYLKITNSGIFIYNSRYSTTPSIELSVNG